MPTPFSSRPHSRSSSISTANSAASARSTTATATPETSVLPSTTSGARSSTSSARSSLSLSRAGGSESEVEAKLARVIEHFQDPKLAIAVDEAEASVDRGYLGGWAGGFGKGGGRKERLDEQERFWLSRQCILRYLDATKGDVPATIARLTDTLVWRRTFRVRDLSSDADVEREAARCKHFYCGTSATSGGHLVHYVRPTEIESHGGGDAQVKHAVWFLEMGDALVEPDVGGTLMLVDMATSRSKKPSLTTTRQALYILQTHYPNRLHAAYFRNMNSIISAFLPLTYPFMDARTSAKLRVGGDPLVDGAASKDELHVEWGGVIDFRPDHPGYFDALKEKHERVTSARMEAWRGQGAKVGYDVNALGVEPAPSV